jgi:hypothetical protein
MKGKIITAKGEYKVEYDKAPTVEKIYRDISYGNIVQKQCFGSKWENFNIKSTQEIFDIALFREHKFFIFVYENESGLFIDESFFVNSIDMEVKYDDNLEVSGFIYEYSIVFQNPEFYHIDSIDVKSFKNKKQIGSILKKYLVKSRIKIYENN